MNFNCSKSLVSATRFANSVLTNSCGPRVTIRSRPVGWKAGSRQARHRKSVRRSRSLFGRTRIALVAKSILLEEVLMTSTSKSVNGFWGRFLNVTTRLCFGLVFFSIFGYLIGISLYLLIDRPTGLDNGLNQLQVAEIEERFHGILSERNSTNRKNFEIDLQSS